MGAVEYSEEELEERAKVLRPHPFDPVLLARSIATDHGATWEEMRCASRLKHLVRGRRILYLTLRERGWSYPAIGRFVGGRDHTTIMAAVRTTPRTRDSEEARLRAKVRAALRPE